MEVVHEGRKFTVAGDRIIEGDYVHACGFYERALIATLMPSFQRAPEAQLPIRVDRDTAKRLNLPLSP